MSLPSFEAPPRDLLAHVELKPGQDVLDVATGTGNIARRAAAAGAQVVGLDLTPELFATARRRAEQHGVAIDWVDGDAEELPFDDESFDVVLSAFGVQFAPRHEVVAHELARVCRPGGTVAVVNWTPEGQVGELLRTVGRYMPKPLRLEFHRGLNPWPFQSPEHYVVFMETHYGPVLKARERLTAEGRWEQCRDDILAMAQRRNEATDGSLLMYAEYLVTVGRKELS